MELLERFKQVLKNSRISELEMSFNFKCPIEEFQEIMSGKKESTQAQDSVMFRFICKELGIRTAYHTMDSFYSKNEAKHMMSFDDKVMISRDDVQTIVERIERDMIKLFKLSPMGIMHPTVDRVLKSAEEDKLI